MLVNLLINVSLTVSSGAWFETPGRGESRREFLIKNEQNDQAGRSVARWGTVGASGERGRATRRRMRRRRRRRRWMKRRR